VVFGRFVLEYLRKRDFFKMSYVCLKCLVASDATVEFAIEIFSSGRFIPEQWAWLDFTQNNLGICSQVGARPNSPMCLL
jgi:hypothetical protein